MRKAPSLVVVLLVVMAAAAACSLTTSLDGYAGPADSSVPEAAAPDADAGGPLPLREAGVDGSTAGYRETVLSDAPLAYYRLGDTGAVAKDEVGAHDGKYVGVVQHGNGALQDDADRAAVFDGASYVEIGDAFPFLGTAPFSIEAWMSPRAVTSDPYCIAAKNSPADGGGVLDGYAMFIGEGTPNELLVSRWRGGPNDTATTAVVVPEVFTHVVATYDGQKMVLYVNGKPVAQKASTRMITTVDRTLTLGASRGGTYCFFRGALDEIAIYGKPLAEERIRAHHDAGRRKP